MKAGWKTSEAHITVLTIVGSFVMSKTQISEDCQKEVVAQVAPWLASSLAAMGYAVSRGIAKLRGGPAVAAVAVAPPAAPAPTRELVENTGKTDVIDMTAKGES